MTRDFNLPPGVSHRDIDLRYAEPTERRCQRCGTWFVPDGDELRCPCEDEDASYVETHNDQAHLPGPL